MRIFKGLIVALFVTTACAANINTTYTLPWYHGNDHGEAMLLKRAAFEMGCDSAKLATTPLGTRDFPYKVVGVTGCSKKATYLYHWDQAAWVLQSDEADSEQEADQH